MPRRPHWTDGPLPWDNAPPGVPNRHLTGNDLSNRLDALAQTAEENHRQAKHHHRQFLEHARDAGEALLEAKRRIGHRLKWGRWRKENFPASIETAKLYARIARRWDEPEFEAARQTGLVTSINAARKLLAGQPFKKPPKKQSEEDHDQNLAQVRRAFHEMMKELNYYEADLLSYRNVFVSMWDGLLEDLRQTVCVAYGDDVYKGTPYWDEMNRLREDAHARIKAARQRRKTTQR